MNNDSRKIERTLNFLFYSFYKESPGQRLRAARHYGGLQDHTPASAGVPVHEVVERGASGRVADDKNYNQ